MKMNFRFHFDFHFRFRFLKVLAFLTPRGLEVPQTVNCLLIDLEVPWHFVNSTWPRGAIDGQLSYLAQKCHSIIVCKYSTWPSGVMDGQLSLDWPRSAIAPKNMATSLLRICRIQRCCSLFSFSTGNTLFGQIWSKKLYCQFKVKLDTQTNSNMQNSMAVFTFFLFDRKYPLLVTLVQNVKIVSLRLNVVASLIRICRIQ